MGSVHPLIHLTGQAEVLLDDIELHDLRFDKLQRGALVKGVYAAKTALDEGQVDRAAQLQYLEEKADPGVYKLVVSLLPDTGSLDARFRLPLVDIAIPALKQLSLKQYKLFKLNLTALGDMNGRVDFLEWSLQKILFNHLDAHFFKLTRARAGGVSPEKLAKAVFDLLGNKARLMIMGEKNRGLYQKGAAKILALNVLSLIK